MVNQWRASGLSKAQFAKDAQVSPNTLRRWVHEQSEESAFVEVVAAHGVGARIELAHEEGPGPSVQAVAIRSDLGIPRSDIRFRMLQAVRASFLCAISPRARSRPPKSRL